MNENNTNELENLKRLYHSCESKYIKITLFMIILNHLPASEKYMTRDKKGNYDRINIVMLAKEVLQIENLSSCQYQIVDALIKYAKETHNGIIYHNKSKLFDKFEYSFEGVDYQNQDIVENIEKLFACVLS